MFVTGLLVRARLSSLQPGAQQEEGIWKVANTLFQCSVLEARPLR